MRGILILMEAVGAKTSRKGPLVVGTGLVALAIFLSGFFIWLTPLPILHAFRKGKSLWGLAAIAVALGILAGLYLGVIPWVEGRFGSAKVFDIFFWLPGIGPEMAVEGFRPGPWGMGYFLFFAAMGALLGELEPKNYSITRLIGEITGLTVLILAIWVLGFTQGRVGDLVGRLEAYFLHLLQTLLSVPQPNEELQVQLKFLQEHAREIAAYTVRLMPAMIVNLILFVTWLNIVVARRLFFREMPFPAAGALRRWRLPFFVVWMVIGAAFLLLADRYLLDTGWLAFVALNAFLVFALIYFFQGLAILVFFSVRWSLSPLVRFLMYGILILFFQPIGLLLMAFGFFDSWFDFRKLTPKGSGAKEN